MAGHFPALKAVPFNTMEKRISVGTYIIIFLFIVFILRLWDLQIIKGEKYKEIAEQNRLRMVEIPAPRGLIYDRNNTALVRNIPSFDISVIKEDLPEDSDTLSALGRLVGLKPQDIRARLERGAVNPFEPVKLRQNVSMEEVARVEAGKIDFPGLLVEVVVSREYIYGDFASHVIGYLGNLTIEQMRNPDYDDVPRRAFTGQHGAEKVFDRTLMGSAGKKVIEVDAMGRIIDVAGILQPVKGSDIRLTIDMKLQAEAEDALKGKAGAIVALDPNTGEILALASKPSFDPNLFARGIGYNDWKRLVNDPKKPFLNRAIQSQYPPGSTFKIITAIAALEEGIITDNTVFECKGWIRLGRRIFRCWKREGHGNIKLHRAMVESCDVYFYEIGKRLGIDTLSKYASDFGLGEPVGVELEGERAGLVPTVAWKLRTKKEKWYKGETLNVVIGQGYLSATPIQMARLMAAVVNGGKLVRPHILKGESSENRPDSTIVIKPENIRLIKKALMGVVSDPNGTGRLARSDIVKIGGKTGTSQVVGGSTYGDVPEKYRDHAWFVAFAPEENPQISVSVFIEHGGYGSTAAAPIAKRLIEAFFKKNAD